MLQSAWYVSLYFMYKYFRINRKIHRERKKKFTQRFIGQLFYLGNPFLATHICKQRDSVL